MEELDELILRVYNGDQDFTENELNDLVTEYEDITVDTIEGGDRRWSRNMETILIIEGKYFSIQWEKGLTENQENEFYDQPIEVSLHEEEIIYTKRTYIAVK